MMESDNIKRMFTMYYENSMLCAEQVVKRLKDPEDQKTHLAALRDAVQTVNGFENNTRKESAALDAIEHDINQNENAIPSEDISEMLQRKLVENKTTKVWAAAVKDFDACVKKARDNLELEDMIVEESNNVIDPYTKKPIEHAVRSRFCNHAFEKTAIIQIFAREKKIKGKNAQIRCPYMGCNQRFTERDLIGVDEEGSD